VSWRAFFGATAGYFNPKPTIEDVRNEFGTIFDQTTITITSDPRDPAVTGNDEQVKVMEPKPHQPL
jgi:hypothetical protein